MKKAYLVGVVVFIFGIIWFFDLGQYFTFQNLKHSIQASQEFYHQNPMLFMVCYFFAYIIVAALPIPGEMTTTLLGGIIMGFAPAIVLVSFASTIGACLAMLTSRYLLRDFFEQKLSSMYAKVQRGFKEDGVYYVFLLRLIPVPFFIVNIVLGLTPVSLRSFYVVSQIGMFPATAIVAKTGAELGLVESPSDIFSPTIVALLIAMGVFPLIAKKLIMILTKKKEEELEL